MVLALGKFDGTDEFWLNRSNERRRDWDAKRICLFWSERGERVRFSRIFGRVFNSVDDWRRFGELIIRSGEDGFRWLREIIGGKIWFPYDLIE